LKLQFSLTIYTSVWLKNNPQVCKQLITLHGMYETITSDDCDRVINATRPVTSMYAYVADKNLDCFKQRGLYEEHKFIKIPNGLPVIETYKLNRKDYQIDESDFVFVLASRALPEKGWKEAIEALEVAQKSTARKLHLILLGDGESRTMLERSEISYRVKKVKPQG